MSNEEIISELLNFIIKKITGVRLMTMRILILKRNA